MIPPVIKWSGSKRSIAGKLGLLIPPGVADYYEPFVGGGALIPHVRRSRGLCGDSIAELIELWRAVRSAPDSLADHYEHHWKNLQRRGHTYYYEVREHFNTHRDADSLLFLSRTCVNGLIRFNGSGLFNNSLHHTRPGIHPDRMRKILRAWSGYVADVEFVAGDYRDTLATAGHDDFAFLDPPYASTRGRYMPKPFDFEEFVVELERLTSAGVRWMVTCDGSAGLREYAHRLPELPSVTSLTLGTGHSPFTRLMGTSLDDVSETVFLNYEPPAEGVHRSGPHRGDGRQLSLMG